jgi:glucose-6-phosphate isomerase
MNETMISSLTISYATWYLKFCVIKQENKIKVYGLKGKKLNYLWHDMIIYGEFLKNQQKNLLELVNDYSNSTRFIVIYKYQLPSDNRNEDLKFKRPACYLC